MSQSRSQFSKDRGMPDRMGVTPKNKKGAYWKHKERRSFLPSDRQSKDALG